MQDLLASSATGGGTLSFSARCCSPSKSLILVAMSMQTIFIKFSFAGHQQLQVRPSPGYDSYTYVCASPGYAYVHTPRLVLFYI